MPPDRQPTAPNMEVSIEEPPPPPHQPAASADNKLKHRVGYWWSDKKSQKLSAAELTPLFAERHCQLVKLDLERSLEEQGPFALIVHKISDILVKADQGDAAASRTISAFESYTRKHPETVVLDPLDNNRALLDRYKQYRLIEQSGLAREVQVITPPFVHLTSTNIHVNKGRIRRSKITFPLVCKPILAQGSTGAHQMCIIFNEAGLKDVKPPCVAQSFVNHNAKLFKLFVIRDKYYVMERPSLKNFQAGDQETVFFYSHDISKPNSSSSLTELDEPDKLRLEELVASMHSLQANNSKQHKCETAINTEQSNREATEPTETKCRKHDQPPQQYPSNLNSSASPGLTTTTSAQIPVLPEQPTTTGDQVEVNKAQLSSVRDLAREPNQPANGCSSSQGPHASNMATGSSPLTLDSGRIDKIVKIFSEKLGLTFYGIDIIIENGTSRYAIIDMNTFPGYDGVENFLSIFRDVVCEAISKNLDQQSQLAKLKSNKRKPTEIDSGIEST